MLSATHAFNCIGLMVKFGPISYEDIPPALLMVQIDMKNSIWFLYLIAHFKIRKSLAKYISNDKQYTSIEQAKPE